MLASAMPEESLQNSDTPKAETRAADHKGSASKILDALGHDQMSLDELIERTGFDTKTVTNLTLDMELEGVIKKVAGGNFVRATA